MRSRPAGPCRRWRQGGGRRGQRVEQGRAIAAVAARQDVGRVGRPEEDALAPKIGAHASSTRVPWASSQRPAIASASRAPFSRGRPRRRGRAARKSPAVARPAGRWRRPAAKSRSASGSVSLPSGEPAGEQGVAARRSPCDMVARDGDELERLAGASRSAGRAASPAQACGRRRARRRLGAHPPPPERRILSA